MKTEPTELNKKEPVLAVNHMVDWTDEGKSITTDICYKWLKIAFREGQSNPKIKQLEWTEGTFFIIANTPFGEYRIPKNIYTNGFIVYFSGKSVAIGYDIDEAKQLAKDNFEQKVRECLITEL